MWYYFIISNKLYESMLHFYSESHHISNAHGIQTRCLDFNPNKPYQVVTGGDDCKIKFWDIRNPSTHTLELKQHTHWYVDVKLHSNFFFYFHFWRLYSLSYQLNFLHCQLSVSSPLLSVSTKGFIAFCLIHFTIN